MTEQETHVKLLREMMRNAQLHIATARMQASHPDVCKHLDKATAALNSFEEELEPLISRT